MKPLLLLAFACISMLAVGQDLPRTEFNASLSENSLAINPGETKTITLSILRSKAWSKSEASLSIPAELPEGVAITFEPAEGLFTESKMNVSLAANTKPGTYTIIVRSEVRHKKKGNLLRLEVGPQSTASSNN